MKTIPQLVHAELTSQPELLYWLEQDVININALARYLRPAIQKQVGELVGTETISMAIRRLQSHQNQKGFKTIHSPKAKNISVQSDIVILTFDKSVPLTRITDSRKFRFFSFAQGRVEAMLAVSQEHIGELSAKAKRQQSDMAAITVTLEDESTETVGAYGHILLLLGLANIPIAEVVTIHDDITLLIADRHVDRAFQILRKL